MKSPEDAELEAAADLVRDFLSVELAREGNSIHVSADELATRLGLRRCAVQTVLDAYDEEETVPVSATSTGWEVAG